MVSRLPISSSMVVASKPSAIFEVCEQILTKLKDSDFTQDDIFSVHLALEEAFINAVTHGNRMDPAKEVKIEFRLDGEKVEIALTDEGRGFEPEDVPDPRLEENLYKTDGRGLLLMRSYMDVVEFKGCGNCVRMVKYKKKGGCHQGTREQHNYKQS